MKKLNKYIMLFAAFAMALASCSKEELNTTEPEGQEVPSTIKVRFGTEAPITKAVSTTDDANFSSSWIADKDTIGVTSYLNATPLESNVYALWGGDAFEAEFKGSYDLATTYQLKGVYPYSETGEVDFGNTRDQIYNAQSGKYDIMVSKTISATLPAKKTLILPMDRQTATVYFHLKSGFDEEVKSVTLVTDEGKPIAAVSATLDTEKGFVPITEDNCNFITLNIKSDGPSVMRTTDMQFWFNVLPVDNTSLKLIVESENRTFTMNKKNNTTTWEAGHLYTTVLEGIPSEKWVEKAGEPEPVEVDYSLSSTGWSNETKYTELVLDDNLKVTAAGGGNTGKFYTTDNTWRFYANESATATFSLKQGYTFKKAKITYGVKDYGKMTFSGNNVESEEELDVTGLSEFSIGTTSTSGEKGKVLITNIYVEYVAGSEPFDPLNPSYAITVNSGANGTVEAKNADSKAITYAKAGDAVTLSAIPETGYTIVANSLKATNSVTGEKIEFTTGTTFTMPAANVIVEAAFEQVEYIVTGITRTDDNHGEVTVNKTTAYYGDEIELTVTPDKGYRLKEGSLKINGSITPTQKVDDETPVENVFVFNMPAEDATVSATFEVIKYELSDQSGSHGRLEFYYPSDLTTAISEAASGESVKVVAVPVDATYQLKSGTLSVYKKGDKSTGYDLENDVFTMPANAVSATATFEDVVFTFTNDPSSNLSYGIYDSDGQEISSKGSIASRSGAANTKTIKLVATNVPSGKTAQWTVTGNADLIATSPVDNVPNAVTFTMPASNVTIKCIAGESSKDITFNPASDITFPKDGITISVTDGTLTNRTDYRVYKNQTMTISSTVGNITNIALTYNSKSYDGGGWEAAYQPNAASWTSPVANGEQARITKIVVTVTGSSSGGDTPTLESIAVKTAPTKVAYTEGDKFDPAGLVITKTMSDATAEDITYSDSNKGDFSFNPSLTTSLATTDTKVTITYGGKSCDQAITVTASGQGGGTTKTLIIDGSKLTSTATTSATDYTYGDFTITMSDGAKAQSSSGDNKFTDSAILIGKSGKYIYNKTPIPGKITKFEIYANKGASAKVSVGVLFSTTAISAYATGTNTYTATLSTLDNVYDCSSKIPDGAKYFWYQVTNANNSQVQFRITYTTE